MFYEHEEDVCSRVAVYLFEKERDDDDISKVIMKDLRK